MFQSSETAAKTAFYNAKQGVETMKVALGVYMEVMTIKDYATSKGISYEAVRRQILRYSDQLKGHITVQNRTQYLDEWAVNFLSERRRQSPIVVVHEDQAEEIETLKQQVSSLRAALEKAHAEILAYREKDIAAQYELLEAKKQLLLLEMKEEEHRETVQKLKDTETELMRVNVQKELDQQRLEELRKQRDAAQAEAGSFQKSLFGFYRKRTY